MKLVVGLGNPGRKYDGTRHNVGFDVIANLGRKYACGRPRSKFDAEWADVRIGDQKVVLACPLTYMNRSGIAVSRLLEFFKLDADQLLVICDDLNLPVGRLRLRPGGSSGGQKGLADIIRRMGTQDFGRLRIGIGQPPPRWDAADYVLGRFGEDDKPVIQTAIERAGQAVETWIALGIQEAMNRFNPDPNATKSKNPPGKAREDPKSAPQNRNSDVDES